MDVLIIYVAAVDLCPVSVPYGPFCVGVISERQHHQSYITVCGGDVLPAAMVTREAGHCRLSAPVATQPSRGSRR